MGTARAARTTSLLAPAAAPGMFDLVEAGKTGLHRAQRLLQRLGKVAPDRHRFAHRFHRGGEDFFGTRELFEGEARHLGHDVIDRRLEGGGGDAGDVVRQLVERVADRELGGDLGDGKAGRLGGKGRGARDARIHLDDDEPAALRVHGELDVRAAGVDADLAQDRERGVAHDLIFLVGKRECRGHGNAVAGMDAHWIDVLDRADDDAIVLAVAHHLHLEFFPAQHRLLDQHLADRRGLEPAAHDLGELGLIVGDPAARAAERE